MNHELREIIDIELYKCIGVQMYRLNYYRKSAIHMFTVHGSRFMVHGSINNIIDFCIPCYRPKLLLTRTDFCGILKLGTCNVYDGKTIIL